MDRNYRYVIKIKPITAVFAVTMDGNFLIPQLVYADKTPKCLPNVHFLRIGILPLQKMTDVMRLS